MTHFAPTFDAFNPQVLTRHRTRRAWARLGPFAVAVLLIGSSATARAARTASTEQEPSPPTQQPPDAAAAPESTAPEGVVILEGQITNAVGAGHKDVTVTVRRRTNDGSEGELIATCTTDEYGDFAVRTTEAVRGPVVVTLTDKLHTPMVLEFDLDPDRPTPFIGQELEGALSIRGQVVDALKGTPVAGAEVKLQANYQDWETKTDESGFFVVDKLVPGKGLLIVEAEGFGRERRKVEISPSEDDISTSSDQPEAKGNPETEGNAEATPDAKADGGAEAAGNAEGKAEAASEPMVAGAPAAYTVKLKPERTLHLKLVDDTGKSIPGVTVEAYDEPRDDFRLLVSDGEGVTVLRGLHFDATVLNLKLTHTDYVSSEGFDRPVSLPADQAESSETIVLPRAGRISGKVTDNQTGKPVNGARLVVGIEYSDDSPRAWVDYQGSYTIEGVRPGKNVVTIHASDHAPELFEVQVRVAEVATLDVQLKPGGTLRGKAVDEEGKPVPRPYVETGFWRGYETLGLRAVGDEQGEFILTGCPADEFEILVRGGGRAPQSKLVQVGRDDPAVVTLTAPAAAPDSPGVTKLKVGTEAPDFEVTTLAGKTIKLSDLKGKVVLLQFWATWCPPCMEELPHVRAVAEQYGSNPGFLLLGISLDYDEPSLRNAITKQKLTWPQVFGEAGGAYKLATAYGVEAIPALILIDAEGKLLQTDLRGPRIKEAVSKALSESKSE